MKNVSLLLIALLFLTGCTYKTPVDISPSYNVLYNYDAKIPGHFALYVDAEEMNQEKLRPQGTHLCGLHTYPVNASEAFKMSVYKTFEKLLEQITMVDRPLTIYQIKTGNYKAMVCVEVKDLDVELAHWGTELELEGDAEIKASLTADTTTGRKLSFTVAADADNVAPMGTACEGGAKAIGGAIEQAIKELMQKMGEKIIYDTEF